MSISECPILLREIEKIPENIFEYSIKGAGFASELRQAIQSSNKPYYRAKYSVENKPDRYFMLTGTTAETANDYKEITDIEDYKENNYIVVNEHYVEQLEKAKQEVSTENIATELNNKLGTAIKGTQDIDATIAKIQNSPQFKNFVNECEKQIKDNGLNESNFENIIQYLDILVGEFKELSLDMGDHSNELSTNISELKSLSINIDENADKLQSKIDRIIDFIDSEVKRLTVNLQGYTTEQLVDILNERGYEVKLKRVRSD